MADSRKQIRTMRTGQMVISVVSFVVALAVSLAIPSGNARAEGMNPCNPCSMKKHNPCNPCSMKKHNPCNPCGGAARVSPSKFVQPEGVTLAKGSKSALAAEGEKLWNDPSIGKSGLACATCHANSYGLMNRSFSKPYPHRVAMPFDRAGVKQVNAAEMVNFCMVVPMKAEPLAWGSQQLAALAAYVETLQAGYHPAAQAGANPCSMKKHNPCNPCSMKRNPCNPCAGRKANPCSSKRW